MTKERLFEKLDAEVERWNLNHPIGTRVRIRTDLLPIAWDHRAGALSGAETAVPALRGMGCRTTSAAFLHGGRPMIFVNGLSISVLLEWCEPCS
jgi:hypothetical protein